MAAPQQTFKTADGKLLVYNPKDGSVSVLAQEQPIVKFLGPTSGMPADLLALFKVLDSVMDQPDFPSLPQAQNYAEPEDVLGPLNYFILVPKDREKLIYKSPIPITAWVTEHANGHKPDYKEHNQHRIMPEQFDWLKKHKDCSIVGWYSDKCPVFASLACQTHAKMIQPCIPQGDNTKAYKASEFVASGSITAQEDVLGAEEREI